MSWRNRNILVTGAAGFLGSWLCQELVNRGAQVTVLVRDLPKDSMLCALASQINEVRGQLQDLPLMTRLLDQYEIETVFHLGAQAIVGRALHNPLETFKSNIEGTWNLLEACRLNPRVKRILIASSDKAYGKAEKSPYDESHPLQGRFPYDVSKSCADLLARSYFETYKLPVVVTRCANLFGGGDRHWSRLVPGTIRSVLRGHRPVIRSDGQYVRDFLYVEDAVDAYITLAEALEKRPELAGEDFNFSVEEPLTVLDMTNKILNLMQTDLSPDVQNIEEAKMEIRVQMLSSDKARRVLNWQAKFGIDEGLRRSIEWYRQFTGV